MAAFSFHCSERWPFGSPPLGFVIFWFLSPSVALLLKAKAFCHLATAVALHWVQGICFLLVAVVRVCQIVDASQERGCTHTDYATCSAAAGLDDTFSVATQDLVTFAL